MRSFQSIVGLAGLVCSAFIEVPFGDSTIANPPRLNTIYPRTNYDPSNIANAETWRTYATKGGWLNCLLDMTDSEAGKAWPDPLNRVPTTASSEWQGTLQGKPLGLTPPLSSPKTSSLCLHPPQSSLRPGTGTRPNTTKTTTATSLTMVMGTTASASRLLHSN